MWPELKCIRIRRTRFVDLGEVNISAYNLVLSGRNFTIFFVQRRKDRSRQRRLDYVIIFIGSRDICAQTRKLS